MTTTRTPLRAGNALAPAVAVASARVASLLAAAVQLPLLTRLLEPADYGRLAVAIAVATYVNVFTDVHTLAFQRFPGTSEDRANYAYAARRTYGTVAGLAVVLLLGGWLLGGDWRYALAIGGWGFGVATSRFVATAWLGWLRPWAYAGSLMTSTAVRTVALVALVAGTADPDLSLALAGGACGIAALLTGPRLSGARRCGDRPWRLRLGLQLALASAAVTVMGNAALLILPAMAEPEPVGRFAAMLQLSSLTSGAALGLLTTVAYPRLRHAWDAGRRRQVHRALADTTLLAVAISGLALAVLSSGDYWLARLAVAEGLHDVRLLPPLVLATTVSTMATITSWEHQLRLSIAALSARTVAATVVGTGLLTLLAFAFGLPGAALGVLALAGTYAVLVAPGTRLCGRRSAATLGLVGVGVLSLVAAPSPTMTAVLSCLGVAAAVAALARRRRARLV